MKIAIMMVMSSSDDVILIEVGKSSDDAEGVSENGRCYSLATPELGGHVQCI